MSTRFILSSSPFLFCPSPRVRAVSNERVNDDTHTRTHSHIKSHGS